MSNNAVKTLGLDTSHEIANSKTPGIRSPHQQQIQFHAWEPQKNHTAQLIQPMRVPTSDRSPAKLRQLAQKRKESIESPGSNEKFPPSLDKNQSTIPIEFIPQTLASPSGSLNRNIILERNPSPFAMPSTHPLTSLTYKSVITPKNLVEQNNANQSDNASRVSQTRSLPTRALNQRRNLKINDPNTEENVQGKLGGGIEGPRPFSQLTSPIRCSREGRLHRTTSSKGFEMRSSQQNWDHQDGFNSKLQLSTLYKTILRPDGPLQLTFAMKESIKIGKILKGQKERRHLGVDIPDEKTLPQITSPKLVKNTPAKNVKKEIIKEIMAEKKSNSFHSPVHKTVKRTSNNVLEHRYIM